MNNVIYCISGLGADEKVFTNLSLESYHLEYIPWLRPLKRETITAYATRMAANIHEEDPVILGVSFGGMMAIEIAKQLPVKKIILVSSIKSTAELPRWMKVAGRLQLNKLLPTRSYKFSEKVDNNRLGVSNDQEREMVRAYRRSADPFYLQWAINQVVNWKNDWQPENLIHIHGDKDKIFPVKKLNTTYLIKEGTHMIIYNRAKEISELLEKELK